MVETYTGIVDRFEREQAVILLESEGEVIDELVVNIEELPEAGQHVDAVLQIELGDREIVNIEYDEVQTEDRKESAQSRFENLSERPPSSDSDRN